MSTPGTSIGTLMSSTDVYPDLNVLNRHGPRPNLSNKRRFKAKYLQQTLFLGQYSLPAAVAPALAPWSVSTNENLTKYLQQTLGIPRSLSGYNHLARHTPRFLQTSPNRRRGPTNCPQPPPWLPGIFSTNARAFKPDAVDPPEPSRILSPVGPPTGSLEALYINDQKNIYIFLMVVWLVQPF